MECFSQYTPRRQSWSESVGKVEGSLSLKAMSWFFSWPFIWLGHPDHYHQNDHYQAVTWVPSWRRQFHKISEIFTFSWFRVLPLLQSLFHLIYPIHTNIGHIPIFSKLKFTQIWGIFQGSSFIFSPNVVKKREGVLLDENWLLLLNGGEMV